MLALLSATLICALQGGVALGASPAADDDAADRAWDARVAGTAGLGLPVLPAPGSSHAAQATAADGARVRVVDGPRLDREGRGWYLITGFGPPGAVGWGAGEFLVRVEPMRAEPAARTAAATLITGRSFEARVTAYSHGTTTRSGTPVRWGVVAVDPRFVPLGSRLMIEGFDTLFVAEDTGGAVLGDHVDIYFPDTGTAFQFGVQRRRITVVD
jgi:3D (Asp-Asp-Asp) domain-containing protein